MSLGSSIAGGAPNVTVMIAGRIIQAPGAGSICVRIHIVTRGVVEGAGTVSQTRVLRRSWRCSAGPSPGSRDRAGGCLPSLDYSFSTFDRLEERLSTASTRHFPRVLLTASPKDEDSNARWTAKT